MAYRAKNMRSLISKKTAASQNITSGYNEALQQQKDLLMDIRERQMQEKKSAELSNLITLLPMFLPNKKTEPKTNTNPLGLDTNLLNTIFNAGENDGS